jgi:AcrR family transcriptional regulator
VTDIRTVSEPPGLTRVRTTAGRLFALRGYESVSMRDLAAEMNIQAPSIYSHVVSKEQLLSLICDRYATDIDAMLTEASSLPTLVSLPGLLNRWREALTRNLDAARIVHGDPAVRDMSIGRLGRVQDTRLQDAMHRRAVPINLTAGLLVAFRNPFMVPTETVEQSSVQAVGELIIEVSQRRAVA